jgi:hypothetical protein
VPAQTPGAQPAAQPPAPGRGAGRGDAQQPQRGRRVSPPQPQQQQGVEYLAGTWSLEYLGRESPISSGPRVGSVAFTRQGTTNVLNMTAEGKTDAGPAYKESGTYEWNAEKKTMTIKERLSGGAELNGVGNWGSPLSMQFESQPIQTKGGLVRLRRTYNIISPQAFQVVEEMSTNNGPWQRLGSGDYTRK